MYEIKKEGKGFHSNYKGYKKNTFPIDREVIVLSFVTGQQQRFRRTKPNEAFNLEGINNTPTPSRQTL